MSDQSNQKSDIRMILWKCNKVLLIIFFAFPLCWNIAVSFTESAAVDKAYAALNSSEAVSFVDFFGSFSLE